MTGLSQVRVTTKEMRETSLCVRQKSCYSARARQWLANGKGALFPQAPFTLILLERERGLYQDLSLQIDPGSKITGIAVVASGEQDRQGVWAAHLKPRAIKKSLDQRRGRRSRQTRDHPVGFENRKCRSGGLPLSIQSRFDNVFETVGFDMQRMENSEIIGIQGTLS